MKWKPMNLKHVCLKLRKGHRAYKIRKTLKCMRWILKNYSECKEYFKIYPEGK